MSATPRSDEPGAVDRRWGESRPLRRAEGESGGAVTGRRWWQRSWQPVGSPALGELGVEEADEFAVACDELVERSGFDDSTARQHDDPRRSVECTEAVAEQERRLAASLLEDRVHDLALGV